MLVPLDGSERAERAIPVAARLARASGGSIVVLQVVTLPTMVAPYPAVDPGTFQAIFDADVAEAKLYLERVMRRSSLMDVRVATDVVIGTAAAAILAAAESQHSDLIVLCSHGYTGMKRWVLGSVAEKVVHHAPVPVLLLREGGPALVGTPPHAEGPLRALVPLDGSVQAKAALVPAARLIAALSAPGPGALHLTRVVLPDAAKISTSEHEALMHKARQYLRTTVDHQRQGLVAPEVAALKLAMTWSVTIDDDIASGIIRVAEDGKEMGDVGTAGSSDLIAMSTHGYSAFQRWMLGSVTERVLQATRLPLLVVPPPDLLDTGDQSHEQANLAVLER
jgi:nucleotide-binding universal stress UspA family protein